MNSTTTNTTVHDNNDSTLHNIKEGIKEGAHDLKEGIKDVAHNISKAAEHNHLYQKGGHLSQKTTVESVEPIGPNAI
uniref:Uncharacterized protein n=1 Tax=Panagrolaimus superbus TaxID=310955 RepID=A0A914Y399_9BILA